MAEVQDLGMNGCAGFSSGPFTIEGKRQIGAKKQEQQSRHIILSHETGPC
jgi:hypothetical protein